MVLSVTQQLPGAGVFLCRKLTFSTFMFRDGGRHFCGEVHLGVTLCAILSRFSSGRLGLFGLTDQPGTQMMQTPQPHFLSTWVVAFARVRRRSWLGRQLLCHSSPGSDRSEFHSCKENYSPTGPCGGDRALPSGLGLIEEIGFLCGIGTAPSAWSPWSCCLSPVISPSPRRHLAPSLADNGATLSGPLLAQDAATAIPSEVAVTRASAGSWPRACGG